MALIYFIKQLRIAIFSLILLSVITGLLYPGAITGVAQLLFPWRANGSLMMQGDKIIGSQLIGQSFDDPKYFWGRLSATTPFPYNAANSSGSNLGPTNPALLTIVKNEVGALNQLIPQVAILVPSDLVTASGSGLDPDISPAAAFYQAPRVARLRKITEDRIIRLVYSQIQGRQFGFLGEPRVNVLQLNLELDKIPSNI